MKILFVPNATGHPPAKLADMELHFTDGALAGLKLVGFAIWKSDANGGTGFSHQSQGVNVTLPSRSYMVGGQKRNFQLLRMAGEQTKDTLALDTFKSVVLKAYGLYLKQTTGQEPMFGEMAHQAPNPAAKAAKTLDQAATALEGLLDL